MTSPNCPPRLAVVAAILDENALQHGTLTEAARLGGDICSKAQLAADADATPQERRLAQALRDEDGDLAPACPALAELLMLADQERPASELAIELSKAFLRSDVSAPVTGRGTGLSAFIDLYRELAMHQLNSQVRNKAAATLYRLIRH